MPPLKTYIFECVSDAQTEIIIKTYGTYIDVLERLLYHVKDINNFKLKSEN